MRVLHFYKTAIPDTVGGVEQVIHQLGRGAARRGHEIAVLSLSPAPDPRVVVTDGYSVHRERIDFEIASTPFSLSSLHRFSQLSKWADIVHFHFPWPFMDLARLVVSLDKPSIVTYHSDIVRQTMLLGLYRPLMNKFLGSADQIVATSSNYLSTSPTLDRFRDRVSVIPIGLDRSNYPAPTTSKIALWRDRLGPKFFLFIGVLRYYKGLHILLDAMHGLDCPLVIIGTGPIEDEIKRRVHKLGLANVHLLGYLPDEDKVAILQLAYGIVFPSHLRSEAFGVSLLEGAMFGKPMISSEIGTGTTFINISSETGLVVPPSDPNGLRDAMRTLWENETLAAEMGRRAEERYRIYFTGDQMNDRYIDLYRRMIAQRRSARAAR
ncbi:glycosyltransferase family 4 protein [Xanthobacteraceae bacterium Astr-EGSB]|uniref:glycosyltransferase family 4 protein n=1 Tax=Astrobacterium formosum TaxID=3069710 RepID=UPI0027AFBBA7|nr:glycosyltransferase family 4 protein [Xanthobacteraceae bacterium Astr-EGSB]